MSFTIQALWLLSSLGATVLAATTSPGWPNVLVMGTGFGVGFFSMGSNRAPDPAWVGCAVALAATAQLVASATTSVRDRLIVLSASACGGALAAISGLLLQMEGLSRVPAMAVGVAFPALSAYLSAHRPEFDPPRIREEALLLMLALGLAVAMAPSLLDGWRSAVALNAQLPVVADSAHLAVPSWTLAAAAMSLATGGLYALVARWRRA